MFSCPEAWSGHTATRRVNFENFSQPAVVGFRADRLRDGRKSGEDCRRTTARRQEFYGIAANRKIKRRCIAATVGGQTNWAVAKRNIDMTVCQKGDSAMMIGVSGVGMQF